MRQIVPAASAEPAQPASAVATSMECPYCTTVIAAHALVCPQCSRDLYLFKPLLAKITALEESLAEHSRSQALALEARLNELQEQLVAGITAGAGLQAAPEATATTSSASPATVNAAAPASAARLLLLLPAMVAMLIGAHLLLLFVYDVRPIWLRVASMVIPLLFGLACQRWRPQALGSNALAGFVAAGVAVTGMLFVTARLDNVPVFPQEAREVREIFEYVMSIGLAFFTGLLLCRLAISRHKAAPGKLARAVAAILSGEKETSLEKVAARIQKVTAAISPAIAAAASIYTGVKALMGDGG